MKDDGSALQGAASWLFHVNETFCEVIKGKVKKG